jgi:hypothetical protein
VATALTGVAVTQPVGRLCVVGAPDAAHAADAPRAAGAARAPVADTANADPARTDPPAARARIDRIGELAQAARYLAPVVVDLPADGSAAGIADVADRVVVVGAGSGEPALLDAVVAVIGADALKIANRVVDAAGWGDRADFVLPDSRLAARAAALGTRALGSLGSTVAALADALETAR